MAARAESLRVTDAYRARLIGMRDGAVRALVLGWQNVTIADLDRSFARFIEPAQTLVAGAQRQAVTLSDLYLAAFISSELRRDESPIGIDPNNYAGKTRDGRALIAVLAPALYAIKIAIVQRRPPEQALASGLSRVVRTARTEVMDAGRMALADAMQSDDRIKAYRRVTHSKPCGACLALAGGTRATNKALEIHASCRCTAEPVVSGVPDSVKRPRGRDLFAALSKAEQDALFVGTGGEAKADLIRQGAVELADLVKRESHPDWPSTVTERPLAELVVISG
jgi:hypothetical protein